MPLILLSLQWLLFNSQVKCKLIFNLLQKTDEDIDFKKSDISKPVTKGELDQEGEELDDDEIEEEKGNEDTAEDGKMSKPACCLIDCKYMNRTILWIALPIITAGYL